MSGRDEPTMENKSLLRHKTMATATATTTATSASPLQRRHRVASSSSSQSACLASAYLRRFALCSSSLALSFCIPFPVSPPLSSLSPLYLTLPLARACSLELLMKIVLNPKRKLCPPPSSAAHKANHPHRLILILITAALSPQFN